MLRMAPSWYFYSPSKVYHPPPLTLSSILLTLDPWPIFPSVSPVRQPHHGNALHHPTPIPHPPLRNYELKYLLVPAMDELDQHLATIMAFYNLSDAIRSAVSIGKRTLNRYYSKTDWSEIYYIAMDTCFSMIYFISLIYRFKISFRSSS